MESDDVDGAVAELLEYLPSNTDEVPPLAPVGDSVLRSTPELRTVMPDRKAATYDVRDVVRSVCDDGEFRELWPRWAGQVVTAFARLGGTPGRVSWPTSPASWPAPSTSPPRRRAPASSACVTPSTCPSSAWSTRRDSCPGKDLEWRGMIRHGAELAFAYAQATVPRLCLILRKAFGGAYIVMDSRGIGNDVCLAWPGAEVAVMGASGAVQILHRDLDDGARADRELAYEEAYLNPWPASERGLVDQVIDPADTRIVLCAVLRQLVHEAGVGGRPEARRRTAIGIERPIAIGIHQGEHKLSPIS